MFIKCLSINHDSRSGLGINIKRCKKIPNSHLVLSRLLPVHGPGWRGVIAATHLNWATKPTTLTHTPILFIYF